MIDNSIYTEYKCKKCGWTTHKQTVCKKCGSTEVYEHCDEDVEQIRLIQWTKRNLDECGDLFGLFAIANGGHRHIATASRLKLSGVKPGVPDLMLPVSRHGKHGLFIEMKRKDGGQLSNHQRNWALFLRNQNYACVKANGFEEAKAILKKYLGF